MSSVTLHTFENDAGDAQIAVYDLFPGVQLTYNAVHMDSFALDFAQKGRLIEIHHCSEGRIEQAFEDAFFYLMPGDLSIAVRDRTAEAYRFPLSHYHGITIAINADVCPELAGVSVQPMAVAQRLCGERRCRILREGKQVANLFAEMYALPEEIRVDYLRMKVIQLLMLLGTLPPEVDEPADAALSRSQVELARRAADYLSQRMDAHITIAELAKVFNVSDTYVKQAFRGVYGVPVFSFMRIQKMQLAAQQLIHTDRPIAEIGYALGYVNQSKFSAAFRSVMGETPRDYRRAHTKLEQLQRG